MLNTLLKIGEWQSHGKSQWDRFLEKPRVEFEDKKGNEIKNYILPILFDLDNKVVSLESILPYDEKYIFRWKAIKIQGGNNKAIYTTVAANKINQIYKTFFGKENSDATGGELMEAINNLDSNLLTNEFKSLLEEIFLLKDIFWNTFSIEKKNGESELNINSIEKKLELSINEKIVLVTISIKSELHYGDTIKCFPELPDYLAFIERKFLKDDVENTQKENIQKSKLCYASGLPEMDVESLNLSNRFSLNKMFVEETKNFATYFDKNRFAINYQVGLHNQEKLDYASNYLLNEGKLRVRIANIDHVIIPQFPDRQDIDMEMALDKIKTKNDLLFSFKALDLFAKNITDELNDIFWLNFIAYESDGNFFKTTETIKDVSSFHFQDVIRAFTEIHFEFSMIQGVNWNSAITEYGQVSAFNFNSIYALIPIRKDKEKKNKALILFKCILENRKVDIQILFSYFCELILCHYFERYNSYTNVPKSSSDYLFFSIRNSVFKYHAFIQVLKKLNLIDMNEDKILTTEDLGNKYDQAIHEFFIKMQLTPHQQAVFYLGRILNIVEFIQKGKKKTVIEKVNFNGMDRDNIQRLRISLLEKSKQYGKIGKVVFTDRKFGELFDFNNWNMNPQEAVFYLLTGYSFGISTKEAEILEENEEETNQ